MNSRPTLHYDVIIIGAGSIGTPTAFFLAKNGIKTLVLDPNASVGQGSSKRAIGGIRATHSDPAKIRLCLRSIEIFSTWKETFGDNIDWYQGGYCFVAYREQEEKTLRNLLNVQKSYGLDISWLDRNELLERVPRLNSAGLIGGTFSPKDGSASPLLATHAFFKHAKENGAEFRFEEKVTEIIVKNNKIAGVRTDQGQYSADIVINAAGPWAKQVSELVGHSIPVNPDSHEAAITEPVSHFLDPMIVDIRTSPGSSNFYFYQHNTGQIIFCLTPNPSIWGYNTNETSDFLPLVARKMVEVMPCLKNIRVRRTWRGLYPMTPDGFPIIGWSREIDGFINAAGTCGQGFMLGPGVGELINRMILNKTTAEDQKTLQIVSPYREFVGQEQLK
jgi:sarcosine oxidase subunit beta